MVESVNCFTKSTRTSTGSPKAYVTDMLAGSRYPETKIAYSGLNQSEKRRFKLILGDLLGAFEKSATLVKEKLSDEIAYPDSYYELKQKELQSFLNEIKVK